MRRRSAAVIACCTLLLTAGCGSSSSSTGSSTGSSTTTAVTTTSSSPSASLNVDKAPRYASVPASAPVQSGIVQIAYRNIAIAPDTVKVKVGSTIRWTNYDPVEHNVTSEGGAGGRYKFASENFGEGGTFEIKATKPGVIHYENTLQPATMNGTIEVVK